jgi:hypothetical protein
MEQCWLRGESSLENPASTGAEGARPRAETLRQKDRGCTQFPSSVRSSGSLTFSGSLFFCPGNNIIARTGGCFNGCFLEYNHLHLYVLPISKREWFYDSLPKQRSSGIRSSHWNRSGRPTLADQFSVFETVLCGKSAASVL